MSNSFIIFYAIPIIQLHYKADRHDAFVHGILVFIHLYVYQIAAKQAATASTQLVNSSKMADKTNTNSTSQHELEMQCKTVNEQLPSLVQGFRGVAQNPDSANAQLTLLKACQEFVQVSTPCLRISSLACHNESSGSLSEDLLMM